MATATCDTSSEVLLYGKRGHIVTPRAISFDSPDSSYSTLSTTKWRTGFVNRSFGSLSTFKRLQEYSKCQVVQEDILEELQIKEIILSDIFSRSFIIVDTTSKTLQQEKVDEIITAECLEFCESHDFINTLNDCLYQIKQNFILVQKIQAELNHFYDDEELDNEPHVEIEIKVNTSRETAENNYDKWLDWFVKNVSDSVRKFFILTIDRV